MTRKKRPAYPPARPQKRPPPTGQGASAAPTTVVTIDTRAAAGRPGIALGARVRILGSGLYAGELAVVQGLVGGVIPAAHVKTEAGRTRRVRTIDLELVAPDARPRPATAASA
jgi:hypothetical protein